MAARSYKMWPITKNRSRRKPSRMRTDFLFATPTFLSGVASVFDLFGSLDWYNHSRTGKEADTEALYSDYRMIGQDIEDAIVGFYVSHPET